MSSPFLSAPGLYQSATAPQLETYVSVSPPEIKEPQPRRSYPILAPNPAGVATAQKRRHEEEELALSAGKRRKRTSSVASAELSDDDRLLVALKEDQNLPWKDIAARFTSERGKVYQVAALQMRYKRLREKHRVWENKDVEALKLAYEYWEKNKWEIVAQRMVDYGVQERWPARHCARKWQEIAPTPEFPTTSLPSQQPLASQFSSPDESSSHFQLYPMP
ncbi:hypothetical protein H2203_004752 [Taxawa tesnikishii (nom. ined.)]|nr:hypothetical protein H2203_004752 [Dothideales sp. JES 119]